MPAPLVKRCSDCGLVKALNEFSKHSACRDGRYSWCRLCHTPRVQARRRDRIAKEGIEAVRERERENTRRSRQNPTVLERQYAYNAARRAATRDVIAAHREEFEAALDRHLAEQRQAEAS